MLQDYKTISNQLSTVQFGSVMSVVRKKVWIFVRYVISGLPSNFVHKKRRKEKERNS